MQVLPWLIAFGGGIVFTLILELRGLSELLAPVRETVSAILGVLG